MAGTKVPLAYFLTTIFAAVLVITFAAAANTLTRARRRTPLPRLPMVKTWVSTWVWFVSSPLRLPEV